MNSVTSKDGTTIAFDRLGDGPPVILVCGGSVDRSSNAPLAALLAQHFTVFNYDRRGRGESGDTPPYAVAREAAAVTIPTLVIAGGASFPFMRITAQTLAEILPHGQARTLDGQEHNVDPQTIAPVLVEFFTG